MSDQLDVDGGLPRLLVKPNCIETLDDGGNWLTGRPATDAFRGKVVLLNAFRFDSLSCHNVIANIRTLLRFTDGRLVVVGVHAPLSSDAHERTALRQRLQMLRITWPVVVDDTSHLRKAYGIDVWPTQLMFDRRGAQRAIVVGDAQDKLVNDTVRSLLLEPPEPV